MHSSVQRSKLTRVARSEKIFDVWDFLTSRSAASIASLGWGGFVSLLSMILRLTSQSLNGGIRLLHPRIVSTCGESLHTQLSSSGAMTIAAERPRHPAMTRRFSRSSSISILSIRWSWPEPLLSNTTNAYLSCMMANCRNSGALP